MDMRNKYLNKNTQFICQAGINVRFISRNCVSDVRVAGEGILTDKCILQLVGSPQPGQCPFTPDPAKNGAPPGPCVSVVIGGGGWNNSSSLKIAGQSALKSSCSLNCSQGGVIKPFSPTFANLTVGDNADIVQIELSAKGGALQKKSVTENSGGSAGIDKTDSSPGIRTAENRNVGKEVYRTEHNEAASNVSESRSQNDKYALCNSDKCDMAESCPYLKTSCEPAETNESKNAGILQKNMGVHSDCGKIESCYWKGFPCSVQYHHIIPVNQCFKTFPSLVRLANFYGYDINNKMNGICLPGMSKGYDGKPESEKLEIAFYVMEHLKMQWHKGPHFYSDPFEELKGVSQKADRIFKNERDHFKTYEKSVNEILQKYQNVLFSRKICRVKNYDLQKKKFCADMDHICKKIELKIREFERDPKKCTGFYVSKKALYYAYYDVLKDYSDEIF